MKTLFSNSTVKSTFVWGIVIILVILKCQGCSNEKDPSPTTVYSPMVGEWRFDADSVKADFKIITFEGQLAVDNESGGSYTTPAGTDLIAHKTPVATGDTPWYIPILKLQGSGDEMLIFTNGEISNDMSSITFKSFQYVDMDVPSQVVSGAFVVSKVKE